jgi:hypothetical protein
MLLVVTTPTVGTSLKQSSIVLARVQRMPEGMTNRPETCFRRTEAVLLVNRQIVGCH